MTAASPVAVSAGLSAADPRRNPFVLGAVAIEAGLLVAFVGIPWMAELLGGSWPSSTGWLFCLLAAVTIPAVDALHKAALHRDWVS